jgi:hypothetical protein
VVPLKKKKTMKTNLKKIALSIALIFSLTLNGFSKEDWEGGVSDSQVLEYLAVNGYSVNSIRLYNETDRLADTSRGYYIVTCSNGNITGIFSNEEGGAE